uniref:ATP synthase F0 subunit 8 n=1 Tax=Verconia nivalis TaxID=1504999 RepID=UPI00226CDE01|nr:ATP synthase F0 subunit 8 [Verconia nivalis]UZI00335.1 ATP synthase F0 subunit 8 [Verconia nivalis]
MPQLSPMLGFLMSATVLFFYVILLCGLSKKNSHVSPTKLGKSSKSSFYFF